MKPLHERMADSRCGLLRRLGSRLVVRGLGAQPGPTFTVRIERDGTPIYTRAGVPAAAALLRRWDIALTDTPGAGTYTYALTVQRDGGSNNVVATNRSLVVATS